MNGAAKPHPEAAQRKKGGGKRQRKDDEHGDEHGDAAGVAKRKRKEGVGGSKKSKHAAAAAEHEQHGIVQEVDVLEAGFSVSVHYASHRRSSSADAGGEWRPGTVVRAYLSAHNGEPIYDIMMHSGVEEKAVAHDRCRMVCNVCLSDKRAFKPPPMFCEKCFQAIHTRWSYWEESGDEGGVKLCKRCFSDLKATSTADRVLSEIAHRNVKIDNFLEKKEKDRPEYVDNWVQCDECHSWLHWTCAMYKGEDTPEDCLFFCGNCRRTRGKTLPKELCVAPSEDLAETVLSKKLQDGLKRELAASGVKAAPVTIRVVSNIDCFAKIAPPPPLPGTAAAHSAAKNGAKVALQNGKVGGREFPYRSKCILAFQRMQGGDGPEVCFFAMYVQEYGSDCPEPNKNRVYISYLDSVRYFESEPMGHRSTVYHSILVAYLQWTRMLGFKYVHIWVEPPKSGDEYIFFARSDQQRKPMKREKLREWYKGMLDKAKAKNVVEHYGTMHDMFNGLKSLAEIPLFHGDQWEITVPSLLGLDDEEYVSAPKSNKLVRMDSKDVVQKAQQEMQHLKRHFLVAVLRDPDLSPMKDNDPVISTDLTDSRQTFLGQCQMCHWQFNTLRHAQYSTRMILNHIHNKPSYCVEDCQRGRVEDGSFMVGCDVCDNWYHGDCVGISKDEANTMDSYLCARCRALDESGGLDEGGGSGGS
mmetsp:Transcript_34368/g.107801  ORF Transcript_34368/g.107801 Transcript_34368/m.107801 type:complete len:696 (+) Transcript_34368:3-2090(+)